MKRRNLVLLPGWDGTGRLFEPLLQVLPPEVHPHVASFPTEEPRNYHQLIPMLREVVPWDEPYTILAESFSGPLALYFAQVQWENIEAVVFCSSFVSNPFAPFLNWAYSMMKQSLAKKRPPKPILKKYLLGKEATPGLESLLMESLKANRPDVLAHRLELIMNTDAGILLKAFEPPVLYLLGSQDDLVGRRGWESVFKARANVVLSEIPGPHLLLQTRPRESWQAIEQFLLKHCWAPALAA